MKRNWLQMITLFLCLGLLIAVIIQHNQISGLHLVAEIMEDLHTESVGEISTLSDQVAELTKQAEIMGDLHAESVEEISALEDKIAELTKQIESLEKNNLANTFKPQQTGKKETFTRGNLILEVSGVHEVRTEEKLAEGIEPYQLTTFVCYPNAVLTVIDAGMSNPAYEEDKKPKPQWGVYDFETDGRVKITNETEPMVLDETTDGVFNLEASVMVLIFAFTE